MAKKKVQKTIPEVAGNEDETQDNQDDTKGKQGRKMTVCPKCGIPTPTRKGKCARELDDGTICGADKPPSTPRQKKTDTTDSKTAPTVAQMVAALKTLKGVDIDKLQGQIDAIKTLGGSQQAKEAMKEWTAK